MVGCVTEQTVDDVVRQVRDALTPEKLAQLDEIADRMVDGEAQFRAFLDAIRGRSTATFYVNTSKLKRLSNGVTLSVRVSGVECGEVMLTKRRRERMFTPKHIKQHFTGCWTSIWLAIAIVWPSTSWYWTARSATISSTRPRRHLRATWRTASAAWRPR